MHARTHRDVLINGLYSFLSKGSRLKSDPYGLQREIAYCSGKIRVKFMAVQEIFLLQNSRIDFGAHPVSCEPSTACSLAGGKVAAV